MKKSECWYGIYPIKFIWRGPWNDPLLRYKGHFFNYYDAENLFFEIWKEETGGEKGYFEPWMKNNGAKVKAHFDYMIELEKADGIA